LGEECNEDDEAGRSNIVGREERQFILPPGANMKQSEVAPKKSLIIEVAIASLLPTSTTSRLRYSLIAGADGAAQGGDPTGRDLTFSLSPAIVPLCIHVFVGGKLCSDLVHVGSCRRMMRTIRPSFSQSPL
jgi:hypothetical protein